MTDEESVYRDFSEGATIHRLAFSWGMSSGSIEDIIRRVLVEKEETAAGDAIHKELASLQAYCESLDSRVDALEAPT